MALEDQDHLPVRKISTGDTFNDWRRITNSIAQAAGEAIETGSHLYLGDFDWTDRVFQASSLRAGFTSGDEITYGANWNPENSLSYDSTHGGVRFTLANITPTATGAGNEKIQQWCRIRTRVPIEPTSTYRIKVKVKNLRQSGSNIIYFGVLGLNEEFKALRTDETPGTFNYPIASGKTLPNNAVTEYSALIHGFNPTTGSFDSSKFDPGSKFFDIFFLNHYRTGAGNGDAWQTTADDVVIQNIEIERLTTGIIITEHDSQDDNPQGKMQIGYSEEDIIPNATVASKASLNLRQDLVVKGGAIVSSSGDSNNLNVDMIYADDGNVTYGDSWHFQFDNAYRYNMGIDENDVANRFYEANSHRSTLRGGRIVMDTEEDGEISSLRSALFIGKSFDYNNRSQEPFGLLNLAIGAANADDVGAGPAINFYSPDDTPANSLGSTTDIELANTTLSGQIACVKSEAHNTNPERYGTGNLVFSVATNQQSLVEILRMHPGGSDDGTTRKVTVGTTLNNADLEILGNLSRIRNVDYQWPTSRTSTGTQGKVLTDDGDGNLSWETIAGITQNITAYVRNQTAPLATIFAWGGELSNMPIGFAECNGQAVENLPNLTQTEKDALAAIIGANLPDLRQKVVVGAIDSVNSFNRNVSAGSAAPTMPAHTHYAFSNSNNGPGVLYRNSDDQVQSSGTQNEVVNEANAENISGVDTTRSYLMLSTTGTANSGKTSSESSGSSTIGNYPPYLAVNYIMKVTADNVADLGISLGDAEFEEFATVGGTNLELGFDTTTLKLSDGHPSWGSTGHLYVRGVDLRMNTEADGSKKDLSRQQGRAIVAASDGLAFNWPNSGVFDFDRINLRGNKVIAGDLSNAEIDATGNQSIITKNYLDTLLNDRLPKETILVYSGDPAEIVDKDTNYLNQGVGNGSVVGPFGFEHVRDSALPDPDSATTDINDAGVTLDVTGRKFTLPEGTYDIEVKTVITMNSFTYNENVGFHAACFIKRESDDVKMLISNVVEVSDDVNSRTTHPCFIKGRIVVPNSPATDTNKFSFSAYSDNNGEAHIGSFKSSGFIGQPDPPQIFISIKKIPTFS